MDGLDSCQKGFFRLISNTTILGVNDVVDVSQSVLCQSSHTTVVKDQWLTPRIGFGPSGTIHHHS
jgi:hypothetical protein